MGPLGIVTFQSDHTASSFGFPASIICGFGKTVNEEEKESANWRSPFYAGG